MASVEEETALIILGPRGRQGTYVLRIEVERPLSVAFGRFHGGSRLPLAPGPYLYVGSAMGRSGSATLSRRLLRHGTRGEGSPHPLRAHMLAAFADAGLGQGLRPPASKKLFWHIDYLLEEQGAILDRALVLCSRERLEGRVAELVAQEPYTRIVAAGLGASDAAGQETHLFAVEATGDWWRLLRRRLEQLLEE